MFRNFIVVLITLTLLLATTGKAIESSVHDCQSMVEKTALVDEHAGHGQMSHENMSFEDMSPETSHVMNGEVDCCKSECSCPNNICSSISYLTSNRMNLSIGFCMDKTSTSGAELSAQFQNSLYRPPIIA